MSRGITITVLAGLALTACLTTGGCGSRKPDPTWHDAAGNTIPEKWKTDEHGKRVPDPHPHDRHGRAWVYDANGNLVPPPPPPGASSHSGGGFWWFGGSGYRSATSSPAYRPGVSPSSGSSSSPSRSSPSSARSGGFGSTGASLSGGG